MPKPTIFISHSHHDTTWCQAFVSALHGLGYSVWYDDKGLRGREQWVSAIEHELGGRDVFAIVLTPESWQLKWVQRELQLALATDRRVVPMLLKAHAQHLQQVAAAILPFFAEHPHA